MSNYNNKNQKPYNKHNAHNNGNQKPHNTHNNNKNFNKNNNQLTIDDKEQYINPYNFITLPDECKRESSENRKGNLNGYIECTLTAKTPIMVPDTRNENGTGHKKYNFFNYDENSETSDKFILPVIPGSEIRGMLRSDYEVFTNSCMSTLSDDVSFISRSKNIKLPGILKKDGKGNWHLYKATRYALHTCRKEGNRDCSRPVNGNSEAIYLVDDENRININNKILKTGDKVKFRFKPSANKYLSATVLEIGTGKDEGILFIGETGGRKTGYTIHDSIFVDTNTRLNVTELNKEVEKLKSIFDMYNDKAFNQMIRNKNRVWYAGYDIENSDILPVWYSELDNKGRTYLSLAAIGKEAYHRKLSELVGEFMPCADRTKVCNACNLFGFVSTKDADSSKIRISDAIYESKENPYDKEMTIKELASPHIANATFYALYAPNTELKHLPRNFDFNYDVKIDSNGIKEIESGDISIRGRKQYWHHEVTENALAGEATERNCTITPVKIGTEFKFKIYFNNIRRENLEELISVINLEYDERELCHKIGKGKPLGFGSCKIKVDEVYLRDISVENGKVKYEIKNYDSYFNNENYSLKDVSLNKFSDMNKTPMKEALRIYDFNYLKNNYPNAKVQYPMAIKNGKEASMYWFMLNKSQNLKDVYVIMTLPRIIDGKDENEENLEGIEIKINEKVIGKTDGLILPKYKN